MSHRLALIAAAALFAPAFSAIPAAIAQDATVYEVVETMRFTNGNGDKRQALAQLYGTLNAGTPLCPAGAPALVGSPVNVCYIAITAQDNIKTSTGTGPASGTFYVVVNTPITNDVDAAELQVVTGSFNGSIDLSQAAATGLGTITATWTASPVPAQQTHLPIDPFTTVSTSGTFTGIFRIPFACGPVSCYNAAASSTDPINPTPVGTNETSLGSATVKLEFTFQ